MEAGLNYMKGHDKAKHSILIKEKKYFNSGKPCSSREEYALKKLDTLVGIPLTSKSFSKIIYKLINWINQ